MAQLLAHIVVVMGALVASPVDAAAQSTLSFLPAEEYDVGAMTDSLAVGDVTSDGRPDVVVVTHEHTGPPSETKLQVLAQQPDGRLVRSAVTIGEALAVEASVALGDFDGDGDLDASVAVNDGVMVSHQRRGGLTPPVFVARISEPMMLIAADFDRSGVDEIAVGTLSATWLVEPPSDEPRKIGPRALDFEIADANDDGRPDLLAAYGSLLTRQFLRSSGEWAAETTAVPDQAYAGFGVGELTGDSSLDWALVLEDNRPESRLDVFAGGEDAQPVAPATSYASIDLPQPVEVRDFDRDGRADVATVHGGWERVGVYPQRPGGGLDDELLFPVPHRTHYPLRGLAAGDLDCDGRLDLATVSTGVVVLRQPRASGPGACRPSARKKVALFGRRTQRPRRARVRVVCAGSCVVRVRAKLLAARRSHVVRRVRATLEPGTARTVRARLGRRERAWVRRAVNRHARARLVFRAKASFGGASIAARRVVRLRR